MSLFTRFQTTNDIPSAYFKDKKEIYGVVVHVTDGDTVRVRHVTSWHSNSKFTGSLSDNTIIIRLAAVDAPETAKQGREGQPYSEEAKKFVTENLKGKKVRIKLLAKDQYGRALGRLKYHKTGLFILTSSERDISEQLLSKGLAVVYRGGGAQYDGGIEQWNKLEQKAILKKRGMWMNGSDKVQLPSQYKRQSKKESCSVKEAESRFPAAQGVMVR